MSVKKINAVQYCGVLGLDNRKRFAAQRLFKDHLQTVDDWGETFYEVGLIEEKPAKQIKTKPVKKRIADEAPPKTEDK